MIVQNWDGITYLEPNAEVVFREGSGSGRLSVIIPCFNCVGFLETALRSLEGSNLPLEIIVVDDGSSVGETGRVDEFLSNFFDESGSFTVLELPGNWGLATARNVGIRFSTSEYFLLLDADNRVYSNRLENALHLMDVEAAHAAFGPLRVFGKSEGVMGTVSFGPRTAMPANFIDALAIYRKSLWSEVGGFFPLSVQGHEDYDFWLGSHELGAKILELPYFLGEYRSSSESMIGSLELPLKRESLNEVWSRHPGLFG